MKRKTFFAAASISVLLLLVAVGYQSVNLGRANPTGISYSNGGRIPPSRVGAEPPIILILNLQNNSFYNEGNVTLALNVTIGNTALNSSRWIDLVYYTVDWQQKNSYVYRYMNDELNPASYSTFLNLTGINGTQIPEGKHTLTVYATEEGQYFDPPVPSGTGLRKIVYYSFQITGTTSVIFTIDRNIPNVFLTLENKTYTTSDIPLNYTVDEPVSKVTYSLDGQDNVTIAGNTTLTGLPFGGHNMTVYAWDATGNIGASETITFTIAEPFSMVSLAVASVTAIFLIGIGALAYFRKHKH
jgi:hypothetical protein